jgi:hypothetical protein
MASIQQSAMQTFTQGEKVTPDILNQNFQVLMTAVNSLNQILSDLGIGTLTPMTFSGLLTTSTTFNQLKLGYVKSITDPMTTTQGNHESRIAALEGIAGVTGTLDGGSF